MRPPQTTIPSSVIMASPRFATRANTYVRWYPKSLNPTFDADTAVPLGVRVDGLYVHVPFCDAICRFCPFNKVPSQTQLVERFVEALCAEVVLYAKRVVLESVRFVYLGGGTPSVLGDDQLARLFLALEQSGIRLRDCEISIEVHPKHLRSERIRAWNTMGIHRLSTGIQAYTEAELARLGSQHTAIDVEEALKALNAASARNYAIDLLYRFDGQSIEDWCCTLDRTIDLRVPHVSAYALVGPLEPTPQERALEADMAALLDEKLTRAGYVHYASCASGGYDYCLDGAIGMYEQSHWGAPQVSYLGLGPGAFGFVDSVTTVNGLGIEAYCESVRRDKLPLASVQLATPQELRHRFFVLGVKTLHVSFSAYRRVFDEEVPQPFMDIIEGLRGEGLLVYDVDGIALTALGRHFVDEISAAFFSAEQSGEIHPEEPEIRRAEISRRNLIARRA